MGLTIHFTLTASRHDAARARAAVEAMRQAALASYLTDVSELHHDINPADDHDESFGAMYPGRRVVETGRDLPPCDEPRDPKPPMTEEEIVAEADAIVEAFEERLERLEMGIEDPDDEPSGKAAWQAELVRMTDGAFVDLDPLESFWFLARSKGSEPLIVGLARYPRTVQHTDRDGEPVTVETGLGLGWHWEGFCKTQYASMPEYGGDDHFVRTHAAACTVLDAAKPAGIHAEVHDESGYFEKRDPQALLDTVGDWNRMAASVVGQMKDRDGDRFDDRDIVSPILRHPNFEHLEAEGEQVFKRKRREHGKDEEPPDTPPGPPPA